MRGPCTFKQRDVTKAVRAVVAAGAPVAKVEVDKEGKIVVVVGEPSKIGVNDKEANEWDRI
jgi:hypothetical protein